MNDKNDIHRRSVIIFGVGYHGRAAYRALRRQSEKWDIRGFLDNSSQKQGGTFDGVKIYRPEELNQLAYDTIAVAGRQVSDIQHQLVTQCGVSSDKIWVMKRSEIQPSCDELLRRSGDIDNMLKVILPMLMTHDFRYWMDTSGLLALMRGQDLAVMSDVDIAIPAEDIHRLHELLSDTNSNHSMTINRHEYDSYCWHKNDISQIVLTPPVDVEKEEPAILEIYAKRMNADHVCWNGNGSLMRVPSIFFGGYDLVEYKEHCLHIPLRAKEYLKLIYGENWTIPAEQWSMSDYNIVVTNE